MTLSSLEQRLRGSQKDFGPLITSYVIGVPGPAKRPRGVGHEQHMHQATQC